MEELNERFEPQIEILDQWSIEHPRLAFASLLASLIIIFASLGVTLIIIYDALTQLFQILR